MPPPGPIVYIQYSGSTAPRAPGPFARVVAAVVAAAVLVVGLVLGVVFFVSAMIALGILWGVLSWRSRKYRDRGASRDGAGEVLEGEWHEVSRDEGWRDGASDRRRRP